MYNKKLISVPSSLLDDSLLFNTVEFQKKRKARIFLRIK